MLNAAAARRPAASATPATEPNRVYPDSNSMQVPYRPAWLGLSLSLILALAVALALTLTLTLTLTPALTLTLALTACRCRCGATADRAPSGL
jgi:hypothetical protein